MNLKLFKKNLRSFYKNWNKYKQDAYGGADVLVVSTSNSSSSHTISDRFCVWLLGYLFVDTTAIFTWKEIHFICPKHKVSLLKAFTSSADEAVSVQLIVHEKKSKDDGGGKLMDEIFHNIRSRLRLKYLSSSTTVKNKYEVVDVENNKLECKIVVGHVEQESLLRSTEIFKYWGNNWNHEMKRLGFDTVNIKDGMSKFAKVDAGEKKDVVKEYIRELDSCGIKQSDERVVDIYLQELPKEAEEKILSAEVSEEENPTLRRRGKKVEAYDSEIDEWILVEDR